MLGRKRVVSRKKAIIVSVAACALLVLRDPTPARAGDPPPPPDGCGTYTECVANCPAPAAIATICLDHMGSCAPGSGGCSGWGCGWGNSKITCTYVEVP